MAASAWRLAEVRGNADRLQRDGAGCRLLPQIGSTDHRNAGASRLARHTNPGSDWIGPHGQFSRRPLSSRRLLWSDGRAGAAQRDRSADFRAGEAQRAGEPLTPILRCRYGCALAGGSLCGFRRARSTIRHSLKPSCRRFQRFRDLWRSSAGWQPRIASVDAVRRRPKVPLARRCKVGKGDGVKLVHSPFSQFALNEKP